jgi:DNA-binding protein H-NS
MTNSITERINQAEKEKDDLKKKLELTITLSQERLDQLEQQYEEKIKLLMNYIESLRKDLGTQALCIDVLQKPQQKQIEVNLNKRYAFYLASGEISRIS